jgi:hypothetical protein
MPARAERMTAFGKAIASLDDAHGRKADLQIGGRKDLGRLKAFVTLRG